MYQLSQQFRIQRIYDNQPQQNQQEIDRDREIALKYMKERILHPDERDMLVWNLVTDVPLIRSPWQYLCFILNVIIPEKWSKTLFMVGIFQLLLAYLIIGWAFSIYWGILIVRKSWEDKKELELFLQKTQLRSDQASAANQNQNQNRR
ncbi:UNKNOWN [Stylonychia lemnae]|uniref:Uncharacterized protein n=1 Tax=Stylonychia lemnae TaxID=5949 RepID=A0A078AI35_STYLE|nr:UNKNOWN [Stylonychia lemnae]|eukprot:CDW81177.1 UNKNOWN [Stylonychia lemnae]